MHRLLLDSREKQKKEVILLSRTKSNERSTPRDVKDKISKILSKQRLCADGSFTTSREIASRTGWTRDASAKKLKSVIDFFGVVRLEYLQNDEKYNEFIELKKKAQNHQTSV
jgi:hypothetical protein